MTLHSLFGTEERVGEPQADSRDAERRVEQLLALNRAAVAMTSELELDNLLQRITDVARDVIGCKYAALGVLGDDGYIERFPTSGISKIDREKIGEPPRGHGLLGVMLRAGRVLRLSDISKDPRRTGFPPHHPAMTTLLGTPIFVRDKLVGNLYLTDKYDGSEFTEQDEQVLQLLSMHAATALTNAQLHGENMEALRRADLERSRSQALLVVTQAVNRSVHLDEVIKLIVHAAVDLLQASGAALFMIEPDDGSDPEKKRRVVARYGIGLEVASGDGSTELPMRGSIAGRAIDRGVTQIVQDTRDETGIVFPRLIGKELRTIVSVPLVALGRKLGALSAYCDEPCAFSQEEVALLEAFGAVASAAIYNASLYTEAQRGREAAELEGQRLRELEQMKDEFLSTAAHELRTPLTAIRMSAGLAYEQLRAQSSRSPEEGGLDPRVLELISLVVDGSQRMHSLVNDLLDLTRLEQRRTTLNIEELDMREVVRTSVEATRPLFESKDQKLAMSVPEFHCWVRGDRQRLEQVLINLLSNAHKYSPSGSAVQIRAIRQGDQCRVTVRDNGPGVPAEEKELVFERFYRSSMHRSDRTSSTGLGLPIARKIAEMHQGKVWVEDAPGGGSIFTLELPAMEEE